MEGKKMKKAIKKLIIIAILSCVAASTQAATIFTDWTSIDSTTTETALGTLSGVGSVTLTGGDLTGAVTDGSSTIFNFPAFFSPSLPTSDWVGILSTPTSDTFTFTFGSAVTDPLIHIMSLATTLTFDAGVTSITKISGSAELLVSGQDVTGGVLNTPPPGSPGPDRHGTIRLDGTFTSFSFDTLFATSPGDGIVFQVGYEQAPTPVPEPSTYALLLTGLIGFGVIRWKKKKQTNK